MITKHTLELDLNQDESYELSYTTESSSGLECHEVFLRIPKKVYEAKLSEFFKSLQEHIEE